jgi:exosortase family protein XrtM
MASPSQTLVFTVKFVIVFGSLMWAFEASRGSAFERFLIEDALLAPTTYLINEVTSQEHVMRIDRTLASPGSNLHVTRGCEGVEMFLMLLAAILAFPCGWKQRLRGLLLGSVIAYALSITRLMALHYILRYCPNIWEALHGLILPLVPIVVIALFFMRWSASALRADAVAP